MKKAAKKTLIFMILATIVVTAMIGFAGCGDKKLDGLYKRHVIGDAISEEAIRIEGNKIQFVLLGWSLDPEKTVTADYIEVDGETTFTRDGNKLILATPFGTNKYYEFEVTKGGNLIGRCPSRIDGTTVEEIFLKPENK